MLHYYNYIISYYTNVITLCFISFHLVHLYSAFRILLDFQMLLYNFSFSCSGHFFHTVSFHFSWGEPPPPRSTPWGAYRSAILYEAVPLSFGLSMQHSFTHSLMADRSMVVGHVLMVHICSFMCTSHIGMTAHALAFIWFGEHSGKLLYAHMT